MSDELRDRYFEWLCSKVGLVRNGDASETHWSLCRQLYETEFVWLIANDDNRMEDGKELFTTFIFEEQLDEIEFEPLHLGCSVLEMMLAISQRTAFDTQEPSVDWFWTLINNLALTQYTDDWYDQNIHDEVAERLEIAIFRTYEPSGLGGWFPLKRAATDQRNVELWYQMAAYLSERLET